jgi:hypothetical protein
MHIYTVHVYAKKLIAYTSDLTFLVFSWVMAAENKN